MQYEAGRLDTSLEAIHHQLLIAQAVSITAESTGDEMRSLVETEGQKRHDLNGILAEGRCFFDDYSSLLRSSHEMFRDDVIRALHY